MGWDFSWSDKLLPKFGLNRISGEASSHVNSERQTDMTRPLCAFCKHPRNRVKMIKINGWLLTKCETKRLKPRPKSTDISKRDVLQNCTKICFPASANRVCHGPASRLLSPIPNPPSSQMGLQVYHKLAVLMCFTEFVSILVLIVFCDKDTATQIWRGASHFMSLFIKKPTHLSP